MSFAKGLSDRIADHVATIRFEHLPASTIAAARHILLDAVGVMLGAGGMSLEADAFIRVAAGDGPCVILGTGLRASAPMAALANGALAHALDYEDAFDRAPAHPNASLVPALIALAQMGAPIDGRRFLTALAVGGDLACRIALSLRQPMEVGGWYPPPIVAGLGAAAGAAHLLGLNAGQVRDALSLMLCQNVMPGEIKHSPGTIIRAVREAFPAQAAVTSALLAREGVAGFEQPMEGKAGFYALYAGGHYDAGDITDRLGTHFWIEELTFKRWPSCRGTHPFVEMALALRAGVAVEEIAAIEVDTDEVQAMLTQPPARKAAPETAIDAKFSIPFTLATALVRGRVGLDDFGAEALADQAVLALAGRVRARVAPGDGWARGSAGRLTLVMRDGRRIVAEQRDALGCPARPLSAEALMAKFVDCAARAAHAVDVGALAGAILSLEQCADVGAVFV